MNVEYHTEERLVLLLLLLLLLEEEPAAMAAATCALKSIDMVVRLSSTNN